MVAPALRLNLLDGIASTGRMIIQLLSFGKIRASQYDPGALRIELKEKKGFIGWLRFLVKWFVLEDVSFLVGLVFWVTAALVAVYILVVLVGPIPPIHQWR